MKYTFETMLNALSQKNSLISVVGAGGKSSFIEWLAMHYSALGKRVIIAPSTKICAGEQKKLCKCAGQRKQEELLLESACGDIVSTVHKAQVCNSQNAVLTVCAKLDEQAKKYVGLSCEKITAFKQLGLADIILCEADGAARKALKAPAAHEPVIPEDSDFCVGFMGLDILYTPLSHENVHRAELFSSVTGLSLGQEINFNHLVLLAQAKQGLFKHVDSTCPKAVFLNKFDTVQDNSLLALWRQAVENCTPNISWWYGSVQDKICKQL